MIFTFGGARSHDIDGFATNSALKKDYTAGILQPDDPLIYEKLKILRTTNCCARIEEVSWWRSEMPTRLEMLHGLETLKAHNWKRILSFPMTDRLPAWNSGRRTFVSRSAESISGKSEKEDFIQ